jgi:hypothetical protein
MLDEEEEIKFLKESSLAGKIAVKTVSYVEKQTVEAMQSA